MVASDVVITKATRKTSFELNALRIPSISISFGLNPIDEHRVLRIPTNCALRARGLTPASLSEHLSRALSERPCSCAATESPQIEKPPQAAPAVQLPPCASHRPRAGERQSRRAHAASLPSARGSSATAWRARRARRGNWPERVWTSPWEWDGRTANRLVHSNRSGGFQPGNEIQANHKYAVFQWVVFGPRLAGKVVHPASTGRKAARNEFNVE